MKLLHKINGILFDAIYLATARYSRGRKRRI